MIVIEEVARVCTASSLIPAVNKLGTVPVLLTGWAAGPRKRVMTAFNDRPESPL